ncbi:MAG: GHKL domain-containing protein [Lachnospiraceae bacterium]|nr:GHKL domain-containing protein [Lachnospiraceae bacterium]
MDYDVIYNIFSVVQIFIRGYCFYRLVKPFMISGVTLDGKCDSQSINVYVTKKKKVAYCIAPAYFLTMLLLLYITPLCIGDFDAYSIGSLIMFFFICLIDRRNYRQKAFLVVLFFSLNSISFAMAEILRDNLYTFAEYTDYMQSHPEDSLWIALYAGISIFYLTLEFVFTAIGIGLVLKVYRNKNADMEKKELLMLVLPALMGVMSYQIIQSHRIAYIIAHFIEGKRNRDVYDMLIILFYAVYVIVIVVIIVLYQDIKAKQEENRQAGLLAVQVESIRRHIEQVESLYRNIRGIRHDMTNHILTLERLYEGNKAEEAKAYSKELTTELTRMTGGIESGNPVTDVILQEFKKEAEESGISFHSEFHYPVDSNINVFDISVILNNALQNAIENTEKGKAMNISIVSYRRNNAYIIEICNSFTGSLQWDVESGLPSTSKEKAEGHGYGLPNIRRVAGKYAGDIDIALRDGEFCLCVMLMIG